MTKNAQEKALEKGKRLFRTDDTKLTIFMRSRKHPEERIYIDKFDDVAQMDKAMKNVLRQHGNYVHINPRKLSNERKNAAKKETAK